MKLRYVIAEYTSWIWAISAALHYDHINSVDAVIKATEMRNACRLWIGENLLETLL